MSLPGPALPGASLPDLSLPGPAVAGVPDPVRAAAAARLVRADTRQALDRLAGLAARLLGTANAQVSLLTDEQLVAGSAPPVPAGPGTPLADSLCTVTATAGEPLVVPDARADLRVHGLPPVRNGVVGSYLGVPLRTSAGHLIGALCVFDPGPHAWSDADVTLLEQVAGSVVAELELSWVSQTFETDRVGWELAIAAARVGTFDLDVVTGRLVWDERMLELFGYQEQTFTQSMAAFEDRVHPDDLLRVLAAVEHALATCGEYDGEYRIVLPGGTTRWVAARGRVLCGPTGQAVRLVGAAYDTTAARDGEARVARVLETVTSAFLAVDPAWQFTYVNSEAERLLGRRRTELLGGVVWDLFPEAVGSAFETHAREAVASGRPVSFAAYYPEPLDAWYDVRAWPAPDGLSVSFLDITERRRAQEQADRAAARLALLSEVGVELSGTLDPEEAVSRLARLVVPALADWCLVTLVDEAHPSAQSGLRDIGSWHGDPARLPQVREYARLRLDALIERSYIDDALRTGQPVTLPSGATPALRDVLRPGPARDVLEALAPDTFCVVPLTARGRTVGLISLFSGQDRGAMTEDEVGTAREVALRAGLALDNARLYADQRRLSEALQLSMLTEPPAPDHLQLVVRYTAAAQAAQVGGDWYDAFLQPDGSTSLVIGDVVGHDTAAAAAMGQVRGLLRGIAVSSGEAPARLLSLLDRAMQTLQVGVTATAVVARLEQTDDERAIGRTRLHWSNAGHPPPLVVHDDGRVELLGVDEPADLLLGIDPGTDRTDRTVVLNRGSTVLLYTDGLVEDRAHTLEDGLTRLVSTVGALADRELAALCDAVLAEMLPARPDDDVALVAVRLHPQDRPRPPEAGPVRVPPDVPEES